MNTPKDKQALWFPSLGSLAKASAQAPLRLCIVTPDLLGPVRNGGIGTACTFLAYSLADAGHDVSVFFSQAGAENPSSSWVEAYKKRGIKVEIAAQVANFKEISVFPNHPPLAMAKIVHDWLAAQEAFDLVLFMEWQGHGFYALNARECGLEFQNTVMAVAIHSPSLWHSVNNAAFPASPAESITWHIERKSIAMCDAVISPSAYMLDWCVQHKFSLPEHVFVQPNILEAAQVETPKEPIEEIVFFGRLEYRKGLEQFCSSLDILARQGRLPRQITFLGKPAWLGDEHSLVWLERRSRDWPCKIALKTNFDQPRALNYLRGPGRMAVIPSVADNSPYTVYECLAEHIPFLARNVGGVAELVAPQDRERILFGDRPAELAEKIAACLGKQPQEARLAFDLAENARDWQEGLPALVKLVREEKNRPLISVCLTHYNRPQMLRQAVDSLLAQSYQDFELLLADDGSPGAESKALLDELEPEFARRGWRVLRLENGYVGRARNILARHARGEWLLFFDDDNVAMPQMLEKCAQAAKNRKGGFISLMFRVFESDGAPDETNARESFLPVGDILAYSALFNAISDATCLIHRKTFQKSGGFSEDYGLGHEDFELLLRLVLAGEPASIIPEALFWYRRSPNKSSVQLNTNALANRMRSFRPFMKTLPPAEAELALMTAGIGLPFCVPAENTAEEDGEEKLPRPGEDPQSPETLDKVVEYLANVNRQDLARQVLETIDDQGSVLSAKCALVAAKAVEVAKAGKIKKLRDILRDFHALKPEEAERAECYAKILKNLPDEASSLRGEILEKLQKLLPDTIRDNLLVASESLKAKNGKNAVEYFFRALDLAEKAYFEHRPDVEEAVQRGDFACALHHYALHGKADKMFWPERKRFGEVLGRMGNAFPLVRNEHERIYKYADDSLAGEMLEIISNN